MDNSQTPNDLRHRPRGVAEWDRGLALRAVALGRAWTLLWEQKNLKANPSPNTTGVLRIPSQILVSHLGT